MRFVVREHPGTTSGSARDTYGAEQLVAASTPTEATQSTLAAAAPSPSLPAGVPADAGVSLPYLALLSSWEPDMSRTCRGCGCKSVVDGRCGICGTRKAVGS